MKSNILRKIRFAFFSVMLLFTGSVLCFASGTGFAAYDLQTNYLTNPIGIDSTAPKFSWKERDYTTRSQKQTSYRIFVADSEANLDAGNYVWDSSKVNSDETTEITYGGTALLPCTRYFWCVTVTDKDGKTSTSEKAFFETGLMDEGWSDAKWIAKSESKKGFDYTSFSVEGDFTVLNQTSSLLFGASDTNNYYMWQISSFEWHVDGRIRPHKCVNGGFSELGAISGITSSYTDLVGKSIHMKVEVTEGTIKTYVDGTLKDTRTVSPFRLGLIGFRSPNPESSTADNIVVKDGDGNVVLSDDFSDSASANFTGGTVSDGVLNLNSLSSISWIDVTDFSKPAEGAPVFRRDFTTDTSKTVKSAKLYATACGIYEMYINGEPVTDSYFNPGSTAYDDHIMYQSYDVTDLVESGDNTVGAVLGHGWFNKANRFFGSILYLKAKLKINYTDGTSDVVVTDGSWDYYRYGPIIQDDFFMGYEYDANREVADWCTPTCDLSKWESPLVNSTDNVLSGNSAAGKLIAQSIPQIKNTQVLPAISVTEPSKGVFIYDLGQNMAGIPEICATAPKGTTITVRYGEILNRANMKGGDGKEGTLYTENLHEALNIDKYTFKGDENGETFKPTLVYHGFRYIEITGLDEALPLSAVKGLLLNTAVTETSSFNCSNPLVNRLYLNALWSARDNFMSVPTDCPQRNERWGWTGDAQVFARTASYFMDINAFYQKYTMDMRDASVNNSIIADVAPASKGSGWYGNGNGYATNGWGDAIVVIPWQIYQQYGNKSIIEDNFTTMCNWVDYLVSTSDNYTRAHSWTGDWLPVNERTPVGVTDTAYCAYVSLLVSKMADVIDDSVNSAKYLDLYNKYRTAWQQNYVLADGCTTACNTQTSYVLGLKFGLFDEDKRENAAKNLVANIGSRGWHLTTGFLGLNLLNPTLSDNGYSSVAYKLLEQEEYPSWLYAVTTGSTTIWESWYALRVYDDGTSSVSSESFNHFSYGAVFEWAFTDILGIERDEQNPAFKHIVLKPELGGTLTNAQGSYDSVRGMIESGWTLDRATGTLGYTASVPANTTATLYLPVTDAATEVLEGAGNAENADGITYTGFENGCKVYELGSGQYQFTTKAANSTDISYVEIKNTQNVDCTVFVGETEFSAFPLKTVISGASILTCTSNDDKFKFLHFVDDDGNVYENSCSVSTDVSIRPVFAYTGADDGLDGGKTVNVTCDIDGVSVEIAGVTHSLPYSFTTPKGENTKITVTSLPYTKDVSGWSFSDYFKREITVSPAENLNISLVTREKQYFEGYDVFEGFDNSIEGWSASCVTISHEVRNGNGYLHFVPTVKSDGSYDPRMYYQFNLSSNGLTGGKYLPAADYNKIVVGFVADSIGADNTPTLYISTEALPSFVNPVRGKSASTRIVTSMADGKTLYEVTFDLSGWSAWTGNILQVYIDLLENVSGDLHVDYVRFVHRDVTLSVDGGTSQTFNPGQTVDLSAITPPSGVGIFKGYTLTKDSGEIISSLVMDADITIYPVFEKYVNPFVFDFEDGKPGKIQPAVVSEYSVVNGVLTFKPDSSNGDMQIKSVTGLGVDSNEYKYIVVKMRHNVPNGSFGSKNFEVFFRRTTDQWFGEKLKETAVQQPSDNGFVTYVFYMGNNAYWNGTIDQIRVDPFEITGDYTIEIDSIEIAKSVKVNVFDGYTDTAVTTVNSPFGYDVDLSALSVPTRSGYNFLGWSFEKNGELLGNTISTEKAELNVYAVWRGSKIWDYNKDGSLGNTSVTNASSYEVKDGALKIVTSPTNADIVIGTATGLGISAEDNKYIVIKMKHNVPDGSFGSKKMQIFFRTTTNQWYGESRRVDVAQAKATDDYVTYVAYMGSNGEWSGTIDQIRIDPFEITGDYTIYIDSIELCSAFDGAEGKLIVTENDGDPIFSCTSGIVTGGISESITFTSADSSVGNVELGSDGKYHFVPQKGGSTRVKVSSNVQGVIDELDITVVDVDNDAVESYSITHDGKTYETTSPLSAFVKGQTLVTVNGCNTDENGKKTYTVHEVFKADGERITDLDEAIRLYDVASLRTKTPTGLRFMASVADSSFGGSKVSDLIVAEYGFIVTTADRFDTYGLDFEDVEAGRAVKGAAYSTSGNVHRSYGDDDGRDVFTGVLTGIPDTSKAYTTELCVRAYYALYDGENVTYVYTDVKKMSVYGFAKKIAGNADLDDETKAMVKKVIDTVENNNDTLVDVGVLYPKN